MNLFSSVQQLSSPLSTEELEFHGTFSVIVFLLLGRISFFYTGSEVLYTGYAA